ncbi:YqaJ-like viral recombinase domain protein [Stenotrophomonas humi]|uniref:YqaJ-like viral recombinase domain protein n=1 Tax=Stenotrophomonas humi TaxID=405444 RepID=A0A0R0C7A0_9GAMM|nr:YqaJ viral recombinase family protein [Stenotrophomonas humi]KRG65200.1 YqaJ-like viral recombinase domain protein [Stenotrophomonas humi]
MKWHNVEQNSPEWDELKLGQPGSSAAATFMAHYGKDFGEPAQKLALRYALERVTGRKSEQNFSNAHMERGHAQEPIAKMLYEELHFVEVTNGGYFDHAEWGDSPDGLVDSDGTVEIKSVIASVHEATIKRGTFDSAYKWQIITHFDGTGRNWVDYASYCADYPEWDQLVVYRTYRDQVEKELSMLRERREQFIELIKTKASEINERKAA